MIIIQQPIPSIPELSGLTANENIKYRWSKYCLIYKSNSNDYLSIYNFLNDGYIIIHKKNIKEYRKYLIENYFLVPENDDELILAQKVRSNIINKPVSTLETISHYTIMTTLDCNARCYYCYECNAVKNVMDQKTAIDVADFIIRKSRDYARLSWFGGEPLYNEHVIDIITNKLRKNHINYQSSMVSNGYLFDPAKIDKYKNEWRLTNVQITLDGTNEVYNKIKNYIYGGNPYERVMNNIDLLSSNGISVAIRLNLSSINKDDLIEVIHDCKKRFKKRKNISIYAHPLFDIDIDDSKSYNEKELKNTYDDLKDIQNEIYKYKNIFTIAKPSFISKGCMANSGNSVVITPVGKLTVCEHHSDDEIIGDIYSDIYDADLINSWNEHFESENLCLDCPFYPGCFALKKCVESNCNKLKRELKTRRFKSLMQQELKKQLTKQLTKRI